MVAHCLSVELEDAAGHDDTLLDPQQRIWGFETNFGGLAELALVKANQLMPKPRHLTWEEAACPGLVNSTAYRQLVSHHGAQMKQGDTVLIWGASGGLGSYATQFALNGGAGPGVRGLLARRRPSCAGGWAPSWSSTGPPRASGSGRTSTPRTRPSGAASATRIRELTGGEDPDIVFEHPGRETFGASVFVAKRGGTIVTCASTSGFHAPVRQPVPVDERQADHRLATSRTTARRGRPTGSIALGRIHPTLSKTYPLEQTGQAAYEVHRNAHQGKVGVLLPGARGGPRRTRPRTCAPGTEPRSTASAAS